MNQKADEEKVRAFRFAPAVSAELRGVLAEYASLFWFIDKRTPTKELPVTIGWSIGGEAEHRRQGAWQFKLRPPAVPQVPFTQMASVEDAFGVLHPVPSIFQNQANERLERDIADRVLVLLHRVLLGQQKISLPGLDEKFGAVDLALLWGPTLPKLVGPLCYTHFSRSKTVAVLEPKYLPSEPPREPAGSWRNEPEEPYWEDRAVRRWSREWTGGADEKSARSGSGTACVNAFDLVLPCGDGVSGVLAGGVPSCGRQLWQHKAQIVKALLDSKSGLDDLDLAPWRAQAIVLPLGMKRAVRAAFMYAPANAARKFVETVEGELTPEGLSVYKECEKTLGRQKVLEDAKIVMLEHIAAHLPLRSAQKSDEPPIMQPQKLAARTRADQSQSVETFIGKARAAVRAKLGNDAVPKEG